MQQSMICIVGRCAGMRVPGYNSKVVTKYKVKYIHMCKKLEFHPYSDSHPLSSDELSLSEITSVTDVWDTCPLILVLD